MKKAFAALLAAGALAVPAGQAVGHEAGVYTIVSIVYGDPIGQAERYVGTLASDNQRCEADRVVVLKKVRPGADLRIAAARTDAEGGFSVGRATELPDGRYYVATPRKELLSNSTHDHFCRPNRSAGVTK